MTSPHYERLSALDAAFLEIEDETCPMHVGAVAIFEAARSRRPEGGIDIERIRSLIESAAGAALPPAHRAHPRQQPCRSGWTTRASTSTTTCGTSRLPAPGDERQLKRLAGHVMSQPLDRSKPLWEMWFVEGLADDRFAIITKTHHCMIDGVGGADLMVALDGREPERDAADAEALARRVRRRRRSSSLAGELRRSLGGGLAALARRSPRRCASRASAARAARSAAAGVGEALGASLHRRRRHRSIVAIGPHRRFDWLRFDLAEVKEVKKQLGGTVNDVVLATVAGALRRFLRRRGVDVATARLPRDGAGEHPRRRTSAARSATASR